MSNIGTVTIAVSPETAIKLKIACDSLGISRSSYVRKLIEVAIDTHFTEKVDAG